ncbi:restriction endonuclease subunit S [Acinetobacter sp. GFQ9D192M]|uniref:restriction endonuclease subunit S n=1 Tax=unclassified Acinetobacter TaxID=196816 RepID=UPI001409CF83|nr:MULTISPECIES: restriction endonuclease subunit S [unclassified Acinetobacter]NHB66457.1 restriction endonuclease subunit S [Acinetobacter sp. GFQ9D191M]NHC01471.1 restriction endonuclease subunit S [Acinetobacter sp. GFQ9D192M]
MASPKLRFKEFDGDWNSIAIGKFLKIKSGLGFKAEEYSTEQEIRLLQIENVGYGAVKWTHNVKFVPTNYLDVHKDLVLKEGDLVLALNRPVTNDQLKIAKLTQEDSPSILYQRVGKLDFLKEDIDKEFIFQIFKKDVKNYVLNSSIGSDQPFISTTDLYKHKLCIPLKEEQTKIASFLSNVDEKISQLTQKHELLSQYKQGMMQKLFSQQLRFKADDGSEFGEWEEIQLRDVAERVTRKNKEDNQNALTISAQMGLVNQQDYFSKQIASRDLSKYYLLHKGEFAYNKSYSAGYPMGAIKRLKLYEKGVVSTLYICFALNDQLNANFFEQYVESGALVPELEKIAQEGARNHGLLNISLQEFFEVVILKPCLEEQTKIANFLSAIDQKIEVVAQQIEQAKQWKKGLLQQMFV